MGYKVLNILARKIKRDASRDYGMDTPDSSASLQQAWLIDSFQFL